MATIPQNIAFSQARQELIAAINYCLQKPFNIKLYEMEIILGDLYQEIQAAAKQEYDANLQAYNAAIEAEKQSEQNLPEEDINEEKSEN